VKAVIEITSGEFSGRRLSVRPPERLSIGRTSLADYAIPSDGQLSSVHFEIELLEHTAIVRDRGSRNGTFVNNQQLADCQLKSGDEIRAGNTTFRIEIEGRLPQPAADQAAISQADSNAHVAQPNMPAQSCSISASGIESPDPFATALVDDEPAVTAAALEAAAWMRQTWLLDYCRQQAEQPSPERILCHALFAVLAEPSDLASLYATVSTTSLGARRMQIVSKLGHPELLPFLIEHFENDDQRTAVEAGKAFEKITGCSVESDVRVALPPADGSQPDAFETEFLDEEKLPDVKLARQFLSEHGARFQSSTRWSRGVDVSGPLTRELFMGLDLEARWEAALRGVYRNELSLGPVQLLKQRPLTTMNR